MWNYTINTTTFTVFVVASKPQKGYNIGYRTFIMKIEVITKYFYPVAAGIETNILETYSILAKLGHKVTIHTSADDYLKKNAFRAQETIKRIKVKRYPFGSELSGYMPAIDWEKADLVCLHNFNFSHLRILVKILLLKVLGKKNFAVVITPHGGFIPEWRVFSWGARIFKFLYQYTVGVVLANLTADGWRAVSEWERAEMIKKGVIKNKIKVITNGLEDEAFKNVEKQASFKIKKTVKSYGNYIIQIGRVYPIKNYETVIRALPNINKKIKYVIVGQTQDEKYLEKLKNLAKELGVEDRLLFAGIVRGIDKYYLIKKAKIMVHMAMYESFCNVVHEGMSQGLVCIVANNTALPLLIKNGANGYVVNTFDHKTLSQKVNYVLNNFNSAKLKAMRSHNKNFGAESSWSFVARKMEKFYLDLLKKVRTK
jgi:glycosyltransferase involved in cell wall biosynthesis